MTGGAAEAGEGASAIPASATAATAPAVQTSDRIERGDWVIIDAPFENARTNRTLARRFINGLSQVVRLDGFQLTLELPRISFVGCVICVKMQTAVLRGAQNERRGVAGSPEEQNVVIPSVRFREGRPVPQIRPDGMGLLP